MKKIVIASNNLGKLNEIGAILTPLDIEIVAQGTLGVGEAEEPYFTFVENALAKARHAAHHAGAAAIADDSGLCVDALGGAPGVRSARYAQDFGQPKGDASNNRVLLEQLAGVSASADRSARFVCALVAVRSADDPQPLVALGRWPGVILAEPRGEAGFGYDPLMFIPELQCSVAELSASDKNARSHRGLASRDMLQQMREVWRLG